MNFLFNWILGRVKDYVLRNWKTTLIGLVGGALVRYIPDESTRTAVLGAIVAALGLVAKDASTSGTTDQPAPARSSALVQTSVDSSVEGAPRVGPYVPLG